MTNNPKRFDDLSPKTKDFLSNLRDDEVETLNEGIRLVSSVKTLGRAMRWLLVGMLGLIMGAVLLYENVVKLFGWMRS